ncbi:MAG: DUF5990 family protein [Gemmatimonadota bacterium]|nr:DUF5990 family protein [Gemmatimonadota bacterium]
MIKNVPVRIVVEGPPPSVRWAVQLGRDDLLPPARIADGRLLFAFSLTVGPSTSEGEPTLRGPAAQGPPAARFVYLNSGKRAGESASCWDRRAKVPLRTITAALLAELGAAPGGVLEVRVAGRAGDGGPACASVPLLGEGWRIVADPVTAR